eukprot:3965241-Pyramimonas_sp.AAC.1
MLVSFGRLLRLGPTLAPMGRYSPLGLRWTSKGHSVTTSWGDPGILETAKDKRAITPPPCGDQNPCRIQQESWILGRVRRH